MTNEKGLTEKSRKRNRSNVKEEGSLQATSTENVGPISYSKLFSVPFSRTEYMQT